MGRITILHASYRDFVAYFHMPIDHAGAANHAVTANLQATRHNDATGNRRIVNADAAVQSGTDYQ